MRNSILADYKVGARKRGLVWDISEQSFNKLINDNCYFCGAQPSTVRAAKRCNGDLTYNGIDRLDNTVGYIQTNVVSCCKICNRAKCNLPIDSFLEWIKNIKDYNG